MQSLNSNDHLELKYVTENIGLEKSKTIPHFENFYMSANCLARKTVHCTILRPKQVRTLQGHVLAGLGLYGNQYMANLQVLRGLTV